MTGGQAEPVHDQVPGKCNCPKRQGPGYCILPAGWGTSHVGYGRCRKHGGNSPSHVKKAEREMAETAVVTYGLRRDVLPEEALLEEVQWTAGAVEWLRGQVQQLDPEGLSWGLAEEKTGHAGGADGGLTYRAGEPVIVKLYQAERKHLVDVCRAAALVGVSERLVRLREAEGRLIVSGLQGLVADLGLSAVQAAVWQTAVPAMLRRLASGEIEAG